MSSCSSSLRQTRYERRKVLPCADEKGPGGAPDKTLGRGGGGGRGGVYSEITPHFPSAALLSRGHMGCNK